MKKSILASAVIAAFACAVSAQTPAPAAQPKPAAAEQKAAPAEQKAAPEIKVEKIATAAAVENREPVNETAAFEKGVGRVFTWTKVTASQVPARIKHVYYADGKKAGEIELNVNSSPYRVWSSKAVWPGNWKVEVTDEAGNVLSSAEFTVSDAKPAAEPAKPEETKK
jgi:hypothetical protein